MREQCSGEQQIPAVSKKQRRLAGMALSVEDGKGKAPSGMMGMSLEELKVYAGTPEKGLSVRKKRKK
jgi:hypothetical protein